MHAFCSLNCDTHPSSAINVFSPPKKCMCCFNRHLPKNQRTCAMTLRKLFIHTLSMTCSSPAKPCGQGGRAGAAAHRQRRDALRPVGRGRGPKLERAAAAGLRKGLVAAAVALAARQRQPAVRAGGLRPTQKACRRFDSGKCCTSMDGGGMRHAVRMRVL